MARTFVWSDVDYPGGTAANLIDNKARQLRVEIKEIINQLLGVPEATALADPIVAVGEDLTTMRTGMGIDAAIVRTIPWFGDRNVATEVGVVASRSFYNILGASALGRLWIPVDLPVGSIITKVGVNILRQKIGHSVVANFYQASGATEITASSVVISGLSASEVWKYSATLNLTVAVDQRFYFEVLLDNTNTDIGFDLGIYAAQVQYTSPAPANR